METSQLYKYFLECGKVTTDTRDCPEGSMFIALKGVSFNGQFQREYFCIASHSERLPLCRSR